MTQWTLRPIAVPDDFPSLSAIITVCRPEPGTVADLQEEEAKNKPELEYRLVAVDGRGAIGGYGLVERHPEERPGQFYVKAWVHPDCRGSGAGVSLAFARRRGFEIDRHLFESTLDHNASDETPFAGVIEPLEASGIRFLTLAGDLPDEAEVFDT